MANPTSIASANLTMLASDIATSAQFINHVMPAVNFKALNIQYQGYLNIPISTTNNFAPFAPSTSFALVFIRNIGGQGSANVTVAVQPTNSGATSPVANLDVGAMFLYVSPLLAAPIVGTIQPGIILVALTTAATTSSNVEIMMAA